MGKSNATANLDAAGQDVRYFNRELSWLRFNDRVLEEALKDGNPPLERLKFLAIVSSNLDEFFMVRVGTLKRQSARGNIRTCPAGMTADEQLGAIRQRVQRTLRLQYRCLNEDVLPLLAEAGIHLPAPTDYTAEQQTVADDLFDRDIFHVLTPLALDPDRDLPAAGSKGIALAFALAPIGDSTRRQPLRYAVVPIPDALDRLWPLPTARGTAAFGLLEDIVRLNAGKLFPGYAVRHHAVFRFTRNADLSVDEARDEDFVQAMTEVLIRREHSFPVRLELRTDSRTLTRVITRTLGVKPTDIYRVPGIIDLKSLMHLAFLPGFDHLRAPAWPPQRQQHIPDDSEELWGHIRERDILLHHPYHSFDPLISLLTLAAADDEVRAIKIVLYRTSGDSPIIDALSRAAHSGKQVTAVVELKARFDEEQNIGWARQLERLGAIVVYGIAQLKIHAKACLIVRREPDGIRRYAHLGTGNYNDRTAKLYTDFGLLTAREGITYETALVFNAVTGYSARPALEYLAMAPTMIRTRLEQLVEREIERSSPATPGLIMAKMNSLACPGIADLLYRASQAGVRVRLNIRGICCLRPGIPGLSDNIRVVSIVGRYLEHSRICYFGNGDAEDEVYLASADWMPRNLDRRVELMFPVLDPEAKQQLIRTLHAFFADTANARELLPSGRYRPRRPRRGEAPFSCQDAFYREARRQAEAARSASHREFVVRRTPPQA